MTFQHHDGHLYATLTAKERAALMQARIIVGDLRDRMANVNEDPHAGLGSALGYAEYGLKDLTREANPLQLCEIEGKE